MTSSDTPYRLWPEWTEQDAVLVAWPHSDTDWAYMLEAVQACYLDLCKAMAKCARLVVACPEPQQLPTDLMSSIPSDRLLIVKVPTNDTWTRDYGFITVKRNDATPLALDFKFNGWGLKFAADKDNLVTSNIFKSALVNYNAKLENRLNFVLEGGSIEIDADGTLLTTSECLLSPNRNGQFDRDQIEEYLLSALGASRMLWLDHGALEGDDTDSHIDTLARFMPGGIIAYSACDREDDSHYKELKLMEAQLSTFRNAKGAPYQLVPLPIPAPIYDGEGMRLPATYANFLLLNGTLLMPVYGDQYYDQLAISNLKTAIGDSIQIEPIDCRALIQQHGSLHCATMQIPRGILI